MDLDALTARWKQIITEWDSELSCWMCTNKLPYRPLMGSHSREYIIGDRRVLRRYHYFTHVFNYAF